MGGGGVFIDSQRCRRKIPVIRPGFYIINVGGGGGGGAAEKGCIGRDNKWYTCTEMF